jgi:hypothetical protein
MGPPHQRGVLCEVLTASQAGMGQQRSGLAAGLERIPPAPNLVECGRKSADPRGVGKH